MLAVLHQEIQVSGINLLLDFESLQLKLAHDVCCSTQRGKQFRRSDFNAFALCNVRLLGAFGFSDCSVAVFPA